MLVPTKDRPHKMRALLDSLRLQKTPLGRIVVIDGGASIEELVMAYKGDLPVEYYSCKPPGQIRQRNFGIALLRDDTPLIALFDDDIVLQEGAVAAMIDCWNRSEPDTAGIGFNIVNNGRAKNSVLRKLFLITADRPGRVLNSGCTTAACPADHDVRCEWLCGGATVWKLEVLKQHTHREIRSRWAIAEDIIFSYPIGRTRPLYVCAEARVRHEHQADFDKVNPHRFHGKSRALWLLYFVTSNRELSLAAHLWMSFGSISGRLLGGVLLRRKDHIEFALGLITGLAMGLAAIIRGRKIVDVIERETAHIG